MPWALSARKVLVVVTISIDEARAKLEQLRAETAAADPFQPAPSIWIAELHRALGVVAPREHVQRYRLDGVQGVNMAYLHRHVAAVLRMIDQPVVRERGVPRESQSASLPGK